MDGISDLNGSRSEPGKQSRPTVYQGAIYPGSFPPFPTHWTSETETFPCSSGGKLQLFSITHHSQEWKSPRALIVFHGMGEHAGRYLHFPHFMQSTVDSVFCLDHRGHGRSEGLRGHVDRFDEFANDAALAIQRFHEILTQRFGQSEIHVLGHSMGGLIALRTLLLHPNLPIYSATISAPLLGIAMPVPILKKSAALIMSRIWGSFHMTSELDAHLLSHDPEVVEAYCTDRLVHQKLTPRFFTELMEAMKDTLSRESGMKYPLQMLVPLQDKIVDSQAALQYFRSLKLRDKHLKTYPDLYHEPFNEVGKEHVFEDLRQWITSHSGN